MRALKKGKRYRYYVSQAAIQKTGEEPTISRIPAAPLDALVTTQIHKLLGTPDKFTCGFEATPETDLAQQRALNLAKEWDQLGVEKQHEFTRNVTKRVTIGQAALWVEVD